MKKLLILSISTFFLYSCGTSKNSTSKSLTGYSEKDIMMTFDEEPILKKATKAKKSLIVASKKKEEEIDFEIFEEDNVDLLGNIIQFAKTFEGTKYKFGGTTQAGMDCSGLVCTAFEQENIALPRISRDMATKGTPVSLREVEKGDLVFFKTDRRRNVISHVGLVVESNSGDIRFIHSTTRAGVIISSLEEAYWKKAFVEVRRVI